MAAVNFQILRGSWRSGFAMDLHTINSVYVGDDQYGHPQFDTTYTELGALMNRLKYKYDQSAAADIVATAAAFLGPQRAKFDLMIPVPPSTVRSVQPVLMLARGICEAIDLPLAECITLTRPTTQLKGIQDPEKRREALAGLHAVDPAITRGKNVLMFDDLFRSGSTLNAITEALLAQGQANTVYALTVTKTRRNR